MTDFGAAENYKTIGLCLFEIGSDSFYICHIENIHGKRIYICIFRVKRICGLYRFVIDRMLAKRALQPFRSRIAVKLTDRKAGVDKTRIYTDKDCFHKFLAISLLQKLSLKWIFLTSS